VSNRNVILREHPVIRGPGAYTPAPHWVQAVAPAWDAKVPTEHCEQNVLTVSDRLPSLKVPAGQKAHVLLVATYWPAGQ
jgi:hypothetical protein